MMCTPSKLIYASNDYRLDETLQFIKDQGYKLIKIDTLDASYRIKYRKRR